MQCWPKVSSQIRCCGFNLSALPWGEGAPHEFVDGLADGRNPRQEVSDILLHCHIPDTRGDHATIDRWGM